MVRESEAAHGRKLQAAAVLQDYRELNGLLAEAKATAIPLRAEGSTDGASAAEAEAFVARVEMLLKSWHFPGVDRVT
jgi:hypothetical protein